MKTCHLVIVTTILACLMTVPTRADLPPMALSAQASTLGLGGDLTIGLTSNLNTRLGFNVFDADFNYEVDNIDYDMGINLFSCSALLDWYPFNNTFFLSAGAVFPDFDATMKATPTGTVNIGGTDYDASSVDVGSLHAQVNNDTRVAPYVGFGWGNALSTHKQIGFLADLGVVFTNSSTVTLTTTGTAVSNADLAQEQNNINDKLDNWKIYPVLALSLYIRF